jgi:superfamily II DNA helicase RecQ
MEFAYRIMFSLRGNASVAAKVTNDVAPISDRNEDLMMECYTKLLTLAKTMAAETNRSSYALIYNNDTLREMSRKLPTNENEFRKITAVTDAKVKAHGVDR